MCNMFCYDVGRVVRDLFIFTEAMTTIHITIGGHWQITAAAQ